MCLIWKSIRAKSPEGLGRYFENFYSEQLNWDIKLEYHYDSRQQPGVHFTYISFQIELYLEVTKWILQYVKHNVRLRRLHLKISCNVWRHQSSLSDDVEIRFSHLTHKSFLDEFLNCQPASLSIKQSYLKCFLIS